jgi:hypothetical protein
VTIEAGGQEYRLVPEAVRTSLSDEAPMLWGFRVHVYRGEELACIKTCFVGRVTVHARDPGAPDAGSDRLVPVLHALALEKIRPAIEAGKLDDEIVFA